MSNLLVVSRITSGLGNQLFQYAAGAALAEQLGRKLCVDTTWFRHFQRGPARRAYRLGHLELPEAENEFLPGLPGTLLGLLLGNQRHLRALSGPLLGTLGWQPVFQKDAVVCPCEMSFEPNTRTIILAGYWQAWANVEPVLSKIQAAFAAFPLSTGAREWKDRIEAGPSAFLHVRRGDYLDIGIPTVPPIFYQRTAKILQQEIPGIRLFLFSDDPELASRELAGLKDLSVPVYKSEFRDIEDLILMASCGAGVLANSSYSWWAAALCPHRTIVSPSIWTYTPEPPAGLLHPAWRVLPA